MASPDYKVVLHRKEHEPPDQVHDAWYFGMPRIYNRHDRYIVTPELKAFPGKRGVPHGASDNDGKEFLLFDTYSPFLVQKHVGRPATLKPPSLEIATEAYRAHSIGVEL